MDKRDVPKLIEGVVIAAVWLLITREPPQPLSTGVIFAIAWLAGRRYFDSGRPHKDSRQPQPQPRSAAEHPCPATGGFMPGRSASRGHNPGLR